MTFRSHYFNAIRMLLLAAISAIFPSATTATPDGVQPVTGFEVNRYLGRWYEIARFDHFFERGLHRVTADYSLRDDGKIRVLNRGYSERKQRWSDAEGKAYLAVGSDTGHLKVSFFGPFYGDYIIFELGRDDYDHAFIAGGSHDYLWLLARTPTVSAQLKEQFLRQAESLGFDTSKLIWVRHE